MDRRSSRERTRDDVWDTLSSKDVGRSIIVGINPDTFEIGDVFSSKNTGSSIIGGIGSSRVEVNDGGSMELGESRSIPRIGDDSRSRSGTRPGVTGLRELDRVFVESGEVSVEGSSTV